MPTKNWKALPLDEKVDHLCESVENFINHQNGANARLSARVKALEEALERIDKAAPKTT